MGHDVELRASIRRILSTRIWPRYLISCVVIVVEQGAYRAVQPTAKFPICLRIPTRQGVQCSSSAALRLAFCG